MAKHYFRRKADRFLAISLAALGGCLSWTVLFLNSASAGQIQRLQGHVPPAVADLRPVGNLPAAQQLDLLIALPLRNREALTSLLRDLYDPNSPQFHRFLTPDQFTTQFGPTESDYQAIAAFASSNRLSVTRTHPNRTLLNVRGSVSDIERTFNVALRVYNHPTEPRTFFSADTEPSVALDVPVLTIVGLNNYYLPRPMNLRKAKQVHLALPLANGSGPGSNYIGNDFRAAYVPGVALAGTGQTVGLLEFDGYVASDIASYESLAGLPTVPLRNVYIDGYNGAAGNNSDEVSLDIEMAISMAPALSSVVVYEESISAINGDDMLSEMASPSQGEPLSLQLSSSWTFATDDSTENSFMQFAAQGQSFFNASGDSDAYASAADVPTPAGDTNITSVGGTTLTTSGPGGSWVSETAWNWGYDANAGQDVGTGGGVTSYNIPPWQQGINMQTNQGSTSFRNIPDVALTADNVWVIYGGGQSAEFGGTSCATPLWAAFTALVNEQAAGFGQPPLGFINPAIYKLAMGPAYAACFHDVTTGNNTNNTSPGLYYAVPGYDLCTGLGTPNGASLINALAPPGLLITPLSGFTSTGYVGGPFSVTNESFTLTNLTSTSLSWTLSNTSSWLNVSHTGGTLAPGGPSTVVTISLNAAASTFGAGTHTSVVLFTNLQDNSAQFRQITLQLQLPPDPLQILPNAGFSSSGYFGGPFTVSSQTLTLTNISETPLRWGLANTSIWLNVSSSSGSLAAHTAAAVTVSLNSVANTLPTANYSTTVFFTNLNDAVIQTRAFSLAVVSPQLVQNGGFETDSFADWTEVGSSTAQEGLLVTANHNFVHSGKYGAALGSQYSFGGISQALATTPGQLYLLSFWFAVPYYSEGTTPNAFQVLWDGGSLYSQIDLPVMAWTNLTFEVSAASSNTVLEFGGMDTPWFLALDDISVSPIFPPQFESVSSSAGTFNLSWNALAGLSYQVQYKTNLLQANWSNLGAALTATSSSMTFSDSSPDPRRFYRLLVLP